MDLTTSKRKACPPTEDSVLTPKKIRTAPPTPPPTTARPSKKTRVAPTTSKSPSLPPTLSRLLSLHTALEQALSLALASTGVGIVLATSAGTGQKGRIPNVINHLTLDNAGTGRRCTIEDLSKLVWLWEWDAKSLTMDQPLASSSKAKKAKTEDDNPFLVSPSESWSRGGMSLVVDPTTIFSRATGKRTPAYGIGVEVELPSDDGPSNAMSAIAKWSSESDDRKAELGRKLSAWIELHNKRRILSRETTRSSSPTPPSIPPIPSADLPPLSSTSPSSPGKKTLTTKTSLSDMMRTPKKSALTGRNIREDFAIPFPVTPVRRPETPENSIATPPETPTKASGSRRSALYERVKLRSLTSPTKGSVEVRVGNSSTGIEKMKLVGPDELKRRCLLGRLGGVAEAVWMLFSAPPQSPSANPTPPTRRRRAIPMDEVVTVVVKSSRVPISEAEASESLNLLTTLCPDFLRSIIIDKSTWLEMPSSSACPPSPSSKESAEEEVRRRTSGKGSPKRVGGRGVGLREVRERIRRELEG